MKNLPVQDDCLKSIFRPDFNIGTDSFHTSEEFIDAVVGFFEEKGYPLGVDRPYSGSMVPLLYHKKEKNVQSIMLEINRSLFLDEPINEKSISYQETKKIVKEFLDLIRA